MTAIAPADSPSYLRHLARRFAGSADPAHRATAERLHAIAGELDELIAMSNPGGAAAERSPPGPPSALSRGADTVIARLRRAQHAPAPTPEQLAELRALRGAKP